MRAIIGTLLALGGSAFVASPLNAQGHEDFVVVVNASNAIQSLSREDLSRYFQKKVTRWDDGQSVIPVDLPESSETRLEFTERVYGRPISAIKAYWHKQIFSGRGVPPVEKASEAEVLSFIGSNANAIGYVSAGTPVNGSVKVVAVVDDNS